MLKKLKLAWHKLREKRTKLSQAIKKRAEQRDDSRNKDNDIYPLW